MENTTAKSWTAEQIEDIYSRYQNGESYTEIAQSYGKSPDSIRGVIRRRKAKDDHIIAEGSRSSDDRSQPTNNSEKIHTYNENGTGDSNEKRITRTFSHSALIRPRRKESGRYYTRRACHGTIR